MPGEFDVRIEWEGWGEVRAALKQATAEVIQALTKAMIENTEDLLGRAIRDAPVDEGTLRGSGSARVNRGRTAVAEVERAYVFDPKSPGSKMVTEKLVKGVKQVTGSDTGSLVDLRGHPVIEGEVGFNTPYAARQHEETTWQHPRGGKAKYLEDNLKEMTSRYVQNLVQSVRGVTR